MNDEALEPTPAPTKSVERLFPFVIKSRGLIIGREMLARSKSRLHFVLITEDISETSRTEVLNDFKHYPVVQHYTAAFLETHFNIKGAKAIGFVKSGLAQSIYTELKAYRINQPLAPGGSNSKKAAPKPDAPSAP